MLIDRFGRVHTSLRVSVTDRCNLRCTYCMPADTPDYQDRASILTFEEIERFIRVSVKLGINDVRVTGGEPLVRAQLPKLIAAIHAIKGLRKVSLTTNGILLKDQINDLFSAGLRSVNVSLDALDEAAFEQATRRRGLSKVIDGINASLALGMKVKVNSIAMRGFTEDQIVAFAQFTKGTGIPVRFIEFMPLDADGNWDTSAVLTGQTILDLFNQRVGPLAPVPGQDPASPAKEYQFTDGRGRIGIIASVSQPFCNTCNRFRITADGQLRNCLFGDDSGDVKHLLRSDLADDALDDAIADRIRAAVEAKRAGHGTDDLSFQRPSRSMYSIGG